MGLREVGTSVPEAPGAWRIRVRDHRGTGIAGAAVMLTDRTALTCAHVVEAALRLPQPHTAQPPDGTVLLDFPAAERGRPEAVRACVADDGWLRSSPVGDLAVLRLEDPPPDRAVPAPLGRCGPGTGTRVRVFGHPVGVPEGIWARGEVVGAGGAQPAWRQIDGLDAVGAPVERGFSGAGVWDVARDLVIGILATVLVPRPRDAGGGGAPRVSWMIPLDVLDGTPFAVPAADGTAVRPQQPVTAGYAPPSSLWPLVDRLLAMDSLRDDAGAQLLSLLPAAIAGGIARRSTPRMQLFQIVRRCGEFGDGPTALVEAVQWMEGSTTAVDDFVAQARRTWPERLGDDG